MAKRRKPKVRPAQQRTIVIVSEASSLVAAMHLVATRQAYGVIYVDDWPGRPGQMFVRTFLAPGHEHRRAELEALVRRSVAISGCTVVDAAELARLGKRGEA